MSSWLSQVCDISLSLTPTVPEAPEKQDSASELLSYNINLRQNSTVSERKIFQKNIFPQHTKPLSKNYQNLKPLSSQEKILFFGSSFSSQIPRSQSQTGSPWALFSSKTAKNASRELFQKLQLPLPTSLFKNTSYEKLNIKISGASLPENTNPEIKPKSKTLDLKHLKDYKETFSSIRENKTDKQNTYSLSSEHKELKKENLYAHLKFSKTASLEKEHKDQQQQQEQQQTNQKKKKLKAITPIIPKPEIGIFTLSYLLTKQGILSDFSAYASHKEVIEATQKELEASHEERLKQLQEAIKQEATAKQWGTLSSIIQWVTPWITIGIATAAIISGTGVFAFIGLFAGLITLTLTLMDVLNVWEKLADILPGKNKIKKQKILKIIQIVMYVLSFVLSIIVLRLESSTVSGFLEGALKGIQPAVLSALAVLRGGTLWTKGSLYYIKSRFSKLEQRIDELNFERDDNYEWSQELLHNIQELFESLNRTLDLQRELVRVQIHAMRR